MKTTIIKTMMAATALMMLCGCSSEEILTDIGSENKTVPISISDNGFVSNVNIKTRTIDSGSSTTFSKGDAIGIYIVHGDYVSDINLKYTYDGAKWSNSMYGTKVPFAAGGKYFAYYPFNNTYSGTTKHVIGSATTAEDFFAPVINGWSPATDQSTPEKYAAQDLMVSMGTFDTDHYTFTMTHQMAMIEMDFAQVKYVVDGLLKYRFDTYNPYNIDEGQYRLIVKPNDASMSVSGKIYATQTAQTGVWSFAETSPEKAYTKTYKLNNESASLTRIYEGVSVGQIYYSDGTCSNTYDAQNTTKTPIGVVVSTDSTYCEPTADNGKYGHGLVMALYNGRICPWKTSNDASNILTPITNLASLYADVSGKSNTDAITTTNADYPAFKAIGSYTPLAPAGTSGWFLPSMGQWWDVLEKVAFYNNGTILSISGKHYDNSSMVYNGHSEGTLAVSALNNVLSKNGLSSNLYDSFAAGMSFWTSSEYDSSIVYYLGLASNGNLYLNVCLKTNKCWVRPFLAF